jgi:hypothetical protein
LALRKVSCQLYAPATVINEKVSPHPMNRRQRAFTNKNENGKGENLCRWQEIVLSHQALNPVT